ncbi:MAG: hypothetical protein IJP82_07035 [Bacteroidaceae bacterium]|nr:hypothetical protein [Bacteroidaceae bacterium]
MTEEEYHYDKEDYSGKTALQLIRELLRLLLVLLWKMLLWLIRKFLKGVLWCMKTAEKGWTHLDNWWHDNDTQEKVAKTKAWLKMAAQTFGRWCVIAGKATLKGLKIGSIATWKGLKIAIKATGRGIIIGIRATIQGIIHLRPTIKRIGNLIVQGAIATWAWMKRCQRGMKLSRIRRKRAYQEFRRNGGVKGMLINTSHSIKSGIQMFMEEDQEEAAPDAVTEDDLMEEAMEASANEGKKSVKIGKTFLSHAKNFMDVE